jgi:hypothetical protein
MKNRRKNVFHSVFILFFHFASLFIRFSFNFHFFIPLNTIPKNGMPWCILLNGFYYGIFRMKCNKELKLWKKRMKIGWKRIEKDEYNSFSSFFIIFSSYYYFVEWRGPFVSYERKNVNTVSVWYICISIGILLVPFFQKNEMWFFSFWGQYYKTTYSSNLGIFVISYSACSWQAFPA